MTTLTTEEIIEMAKESNLLDVIDSFHYETNIWVEEATAFAKLVDAKATAREREACAKLVDDNAKACINNSMAQMVLYANATAIRARGNT
jgi:hypothetical protein